MKILPELFSRHHVRLERMIPSLSNCRLLECKKLSGLSNTSYKLSFDGHPSSVVVKFHQNLFPMFVNRDIEARVLRHTSNHHLFPKLYAQEDWGCVYEFKEGEQLHNTEVSIKTLEEIVSRLGQVSRLCENTQGSRNQTRVFSNVVSRCKQIAKQIQDKYPQRLARNKSHINDMTDDSIMANIQKCLPSSMIFSHNDSNLTNFIKTDEGLLLLDFEFSCHNYVGFDLGNLLNQLATEYSDIFEIRPEWEISPEYQKILTRNYLRSIGVEVEDPVRTVQVGRLLSHHFWFFIGLLSFNDPHCRLDLNYYLERRHSQFLKYYHQLC